MISWEEIYGLQIFRCTNPDASIPGVKFPSIATIAADLPEKNT